MKRTPTATLILSLATTLALAAACGDDPPAKSGGSSTAPGPLDRYWLATAPEGAKSVIDVRRDAKDGDEVVVTGKVGGDREVFVERKAVFTLMDASLKDCIERGDGCKTPWDYCCEEPTTIAASSATVEFHDAAGAVLPVPARGFHGLDHLKHVVLKGRVRKDAQGNVSVVASGIHVRN